MKRNVENHLKLKMDVQKLDKSELRKAVLLSEVLGKPIALKEKSQR